METKQSSISFSLPFLLLLVSISSFTETAFVAFNRSSFPPDFIFGAASSAYQVEGAAFEFGKGPSIWDNFTHQYPEKIDDRSNGDVADNFYHRFKHDVKLMKFIGLDTFRMSISWTRILPRGKLSGGVNKKGIAFYNKLFNTLLAHGIIPFVTIFNWDVPQALEDEYEGFLSPLIIDDFRDFAELCFKEFGDRVKHWITISNAYIFSTHGYDEGNTAPGRCSSRANCPQGNSATEPYIVVHHLLLSHATIVKLYKEKYQGVQKGIIGMTNESPWYVPYSNSKLDTKAAQRALDFEYGWFVNPIVYGDYPRIMKSLVGSRLPSFTKEQSAMLKGSFDFLGLNYFTSNYASHVSSRSGNVSSTTDSMVRLSTSRNGVPIGQPTAAIPFYVYPKGLYDLLVYTKKKYNSPTIYIAENGMADRGNLTIKQGVNDRQRIDFFHRHLQAVRKAIGNDVNVKGFMAWSFLDDFEWAHGHTLRFGFYYVDFTSGLKRIPKKSAIWFKKFLKKK